MNKSLLSANRPYLVIPKLIKQPTWGGSYIVQSKGWMNRPGHDIKIGQSYELFSGSNLSVLSSSSDPLFQGEITDNVAVEKPTTPANSISLSDLTAIDPEIVLGRSVVSERGPQIALLIKFTQALGNSFQVHIKDGVSHPTWKPKPESWYYFEPGLLTLGIKAGTDWDAYKTAVQTVSDGMNSLSAEVTAGTLSFQDAQSKISLLLQQYDPWQFVNIVEIEKDQVVDLSQGGLHHSWEEDPVKAPLGNVLLELQSEALDDISTFRSFDKGKMGSDGSVRAVHIDTYFDVIDRSPEANNPINHIQSQELLSESSDYRLEKLMRCRHYNMDKLTLMQQNARFEESIERYKHIFVKAGSVRVVAGEGEVTVGSGHSCFVPAGCNRFMVENLSDRSEILVSF